MVEHITQILLITTCLKKLKVVSFQRSDCQTSVDVCNDNFNVIGT